MTSEVRDLEAVPSIRQPGPALGVFWGLAVVVAAMAVLPFFIGTYWLLLLLPFLGYAIAGLGFNLLFGFTGLLSFGHAMFIAIGAYTVAALSAFPQFSSFELMLAVAVVISILVAIPVGALCVRYKGIFFAFLTLAFSMLFHSFLIKFYHLTGGDEGMSIHRPLLLGNEFDVSQSVFLTGPFYYYVLILFAVLSLLMWRLVRSPLGLHLRAVRENPQKAAFIGVNVYLMRFIAFIISAVYCAVGGVVLGCVIGLASPELASWTHSGDLVFMTVLGGSGSVAGPVVGSLIFVLLQDAVMTVTDSWRFLMGGILVLLVIFAPGGLISIAGNFVKRWMWGGGQEP